MVSMYISPKEKVKLYLTNFNFILTAYIVIAVLASAAKYFTSQGEYTGYNNYLIFKTSFQHLIACKDIYTFFPQEHFDLYRYSPSFAIFMGPFTLLPDLLGFMLWNLINVLVLFFAIYTLPLKSDKLRVFVMWFVLQELLTSVQSSQSNGPIAGLIILTFNYLEKKNHLLAALMVICSIYIKLFGVVAFALFFLYPHKLKSIAYLCFWTIVIGLLPLLFISPDLLIKTYISWKAQLSSDYIFFQGMSVMNWLQVWFHIDVNKQWVVLIGAVIFCIPLFRTDLYKDIYFRCLFLCSILIWVVIFNHKAESPTFIIAVSGIGIWYFMQQASSINKALVIFAFIFTCLSSTDVFPSYIRENFTDVYILKMFPCLLIWLNIIYELSFHTYIPRSDNYFVVSEEEKFI
jgi:hypothetical protein